MSCSSLENAKLPVTTTISQYSFAVTNLGNIEIPLAETIGTSAFESTKLTKITCPSVKTVGYNAFAQSVFLEQANFYVVEQINKTAFNLCSRLTTLIIRTETLCEVKSTSSADFLRGTPIANGTGYIYVPRALVDSYKAASRWSTYANQIRAIEDYRDIITDYSWEGVQYYIDNGTYASAYKIGDTVPLDLGSEGLVNMQIAAFDTDDLADGSGKAPITWISKELLKTKYRMNPALVEVYDYKEQAATTTTNNNTSVSANSTKTTSFRTYIQAEEIAEITNVITATADGTLTITYAGLPVTYGKLKVTVNGEVVVSDYTSTTSVAHTMEVAIGDVVTIVAQYTSVRTTSSSSSIKLASTGTFNLTTTCNNVISRYSAGYQEGTGAIGGWEKCEMRTYLNDTIKPLIPEAVRSKIKAVTKTQGAYDTAGSKFTQTTIDEAWIPSDSEVDRKYVLLFSNKSLTKFIVGTSNVSNWWARDVATTSNFAYANNNTASVSTNQHGIALGFCM